MKIFSCCLILFLASSEASAFMIAPSSQSSSGIAKQQQCINPIIKHLNKNRQSYMSTSSLHVSIGCYATTGAANTVLSSLKIRHPAKVFVLLLTAATTILLTATKREKYRRLMDRAAVSSDNEYSDVPLPPGGYGCPFFGKFFLIYSY